MPNVLICRKIRVISGRGGRVFNKARQYKERGRALRKFRRARRLGQGPMR